MKNIWKVKKKSLHKCGEEQRIGRYGICVMSYFFMLFSCFLLLFGGEWVNIDVKVEESGEKVVQSG